MTTLAQTNVNIGLEPEQIAGVLGVLKGVLADAHVLYIRTRGYHWNVVGPQFESLHKLFETQYDQLEEEIDGVAERIRSLGAQAPGSMTEFLRLTSMREEPGDYPNAQGMLRQLVADHEALIRTLRRGVDECTDRYHDVGTADFLTGLLEAHEKTAWMLRAHLEG